MRIKSKQFGSYENGTFIAMWTLCPKGQTVNRDIKADPFLTVLSIVFSLSRAVVALFRAVSLSDRVKLSIALTL
jgi:hypothetical protein